ncbi:MAG TPA: response regulator [Verrucomicrobiae bacterium]|nr:response regulator [Verrucomicrobiae bacterium]
MARGKILIIDDEMEIRDFLKDFFEDREFDVQTAPNGEQGVEIFKPGAFDLVICDMLMPRMIGLEVLRRIKEAAPQQAVIMMTGVKEGSMVDKAKKLGCYHYLTKPVGLSDLEAKVNECFT